MSLAELVYYTSRGQNDFVGIPVFPSRVFRHSFIFYHPRSGIRRPQDLSGKKEGEREVRL
jgi:4,5-dihydroxyphthalate decarboxylase